MSTKMAQRHAHQYADYSYSRPKTNTKINPPINPELKTKNTPTKVKKVDRAALFKSRAKLFLYIAVVFAVGILMISRYINISETGNHLSILKTQYTQIEKENQQLKLQIDKSIDLKQLEVIATERFGMMRPERNQLFYIDMQLSDYGEKVNKKNDKAQMEEAIVYGVPGVLIKAIETLK